MRGETSSTLPAQNNHRNWRTFYRSPNQPQSRGIDDRPPHCKTDSSDSNAHTRRTSGMSAADRSSPLFQCRCRSDNTSSQSPLYFHPSIISHRFTASLNVFAMCSAFLFVYSFAFFTSKSRCPAPSSGYRVVARAGITAYPSSTP